MKKILYALLLSILPLGVSHGMQNQPNWNQLNQNLTHCQKDAQKALLAEDNAWTALKQLGPKPDDPMLARTWRPKSKKLGGAHSEALKNANSALDAVDAAMEELTEALKNGNNITPAEEENMNNALTQTQKNVKLMKKQLNHENQ